MPSMSTKRSRDSHNKLSIVGYLGHFRHPQQPKRQQPYNNQTINMLKSYRGIWCALAKLCAQLDNEISPRTASPPRALLPTIVGAAYCVCIFPCKYLCKTIPEFRARNATRRSLLWRRWAHSMIVEWFGNIRMPTQCWLNHYAMP